MKAIITRIVYPRTPKPDGWTVFRIKPDTEPECPAVGHLTSDITVGSAVDITGKWTQHPTYGRQFKVDTIVAITPSTTRGVEKWLASGQVGNVGKATARKICQHFGDETPVIIDKYPERIAEVPGVGRARVQGLISGLQGNRSTRTLIEWLGPFGVTMGMVNKLIASFRNPEEALQECHRNPYWSLRSTDVPFNIVDKVALADGMEQDDPIRLNAVAQHKLGGFARDGHCYAPAGELLGAMSDLLKFPPDRALAWADKSLTIEPWGVYKTHVRNQENAVDAWLRRSVIEEPILDDTHDLDKEISDAAKLCSVVLSPRQFEAIKLTMLHRAVVVTGGPGTGKTTIVQVMVKLMESCGRDVRLLAPTGRAQLRLGQVCMRDASTIHKALIPVDHGEGPWDEDVIIVDEVSMVDIELMSRTVAAIKGGGRLVMVGDYHQLPSVGAGNVLKDIIDSELVPCVKLDVIFRQAQESTIILNAHKIIAGIPIENGGDCWLDFWKPRDGEEPKDYGERMEDRIVHVVADILPKKGFDPLTDTQVLLPMYKHRPGIDATNQELQSRLNPPSDRPEMKWGTITFRVGDKVMQMKNNYKIEVFNGEIGIVIDASDKPKRLGVQFVGGRVCEYDPETINELKLAYAVSIHKSQGSEYPCVVVGFSRSHNIMLVRNLIYTALTRAKKYCTIVGDRVAVSMAINNDKPIYRNTRLLR